MNSTYHWTQQLRLTPYPGTAELFRLSITYNDWPAEQIFSRVHVPKPLQAALLAGAKPLGLQLLSLEINGRASSALPEAPEHVVVGVTVPDGSRVWHSPRPWVRLRRRALALTATAALGAAALAPLAAQSGGIAVATLSAAAALALSRAVRTQKSVSFRPFSVFVEVGRPAT